MGWFDYFSDLASAITIQDTAADASQSRGSTESAPPSGGASTKSPASGSDEESDEEAEANAETAANAKERTSDDGEEGGDDEGEGGDDAAEEEEEAEEDEDDDEPEDIKDKLEEECMKTSACAPLKHHYDECAERVQSQIDDNGKADEDCVEEFFHMMHCASQCAAPKLFKSLR